jgi:hypothetical protein
MHKLRYFIALAALLLPGIALAETVKQSGIIAAGQEQRPVLPKACPKQGAEAIRSVSKIAGKDLPHLDHLMLLCVAEALKNQEERLKALEAAGSR